MSVCAGVVILLSLYDPVAPGWAFERLTSQSIPPPQAPPRSRNGPLGAAITTNSPTWGKLLERADVQGALVLGLAPGTPAKSAGLVRGDVIVAIDEEAIGNADRYTAVLREAVSPDHLLAVVGPSGAARSITVRLPAAPARELSYRSYLSTSSTPDVVDDYFIASESSDVSAAANAAKTLVAEAPMFGPGYILLARQTLNAAQRSSGPVVSRDVIDLVESLVSNALDKDSESVDVLLGAGQIAMRLGRLVTAADFAQRAVSADPTSAEGHYLLGSLKLQLGQPQDSLPVLRQSVDLDPYAIPYYQALGRAYAAVGRPQDSEATSAVASLLSSRQNQGNSNGNRLRIALTIGGVLLGSVLIIAIAGAKSSLPRGRSEKMTAWSLVRHFTPGAQLGLLEFLVVVGIWAIAVPLLAPVTGVHRLSNVRLGIADYWIPGSIVVISSAVGAWWHLVHRTGRKWQIYIHTVLLACGIWMMGAHIGMIGGVLSGSPPVGDVIHYTLAGTIITAGAVLLLYIVWKGSEDGFDNESIEGVTT